MENVKDEKLILPKKLVKMLREKRTLSLPLVTKECGISVSDAFNTLKILLEENILEDAGDGTFKVIEEDDAIGSEFVGREKWNRKWTYETLKEAAPEVFSPGFCFVMKKLSELGSVRCSDAVEVLKRPAELYVLIKRGLVIDDDEAFYSTVSGDEFNEFIKKHIALTGENPLEEISDADSEKEEKSDDTDKSKSCETVSDDDDDIIWGTDVFDDVTDIMDEDTYELPDEDDTELITDKVQTVQQCTRDYMFFKRRKYINFGSYPQKEVTDDGLITELNRISGKKPTPENPDGWISYGYYAKSKNPENCWWFKDVTYEGKKYRGVYFTAWREESSEGYLEYEHPIYSKKKRYWFEFQPIRWSVLWEDKPLEEMFIMSDVILDSQPFISFHHGDEQLAVKDHVLSFSVWEDSTLREWLRTLFTDTAFTPEEKGRITETESVTESRIGDEEITSDTVFLPSFDELTEPGMKFEEDEFEKDYSRVIYPSDYAVCQGLKIIPELVSCKDGHWWLRTASNDAADMCVVDSEGRIIRTAEVDETSVGVVPAMVIKK